MLLSTSIGSFFNNYSLEEIVELCSEAGFDALDFSFCDSEKYYDEETDSESFKARFQDLRKLAEQKGMCFNQAHAPLGSGSLDPVWTENRFKEIVRSMRNASYLGVPTIIVHPKTYLKYAKEGNPEKLFEINMEFYRRLIPYCQEYNIRIGVENMWQKTGAKIVPSVCAKPAEFVRYLDALDSEWITGCLDIGHACLVCEKPADFIRTLGRKRLQTLHVHDVDGIDDTHTMPYLGIVDWEETVGALKEIGYEGDFTFECISFLNKPRELQGIAARHLEVTGRYLMKMMGK